MDDILLLQGIGDGLTREGLTGPMLVVLAAAAKQPGITLPEINMRAELPVCDKNAKTLIARDYLRRDGLKTTRVNNRDYHANAYTTTPEGIAALRRIAKLGRAAIQSAQSETSGVPA